MPNQFCDCCGKELSDKIQEWGGLWLNLQNRAVSMHYHKECAQKVYDAVMACCERVKKEGAEDVETRDENR